MIPFSTPQGHEIKAILCSLLEVVGDVKAGSRGLFG